MAPDDLSDLATVLSGRFGGYGDRPAIRVDRNLTVSYRELLRLSAAIGTHLDRLGVAPGAAVAVVGRAGLGTYAGLLGSLLTRRVPAMVDRGQSAVRVRQMLALLDPVATLWCGGAEPQTPGRAAVLHVDDTAQATADPRYLDAPRQDAPVFAPSVGYVGFTSGSRGAPRAIVGSAAGLLHFLTWQADTFGIRPGARFGQLTSVGFDVFYRDLLTPLISGASVCVPGAEQLRGGGVLDWLAAARVTHLHAVPSLARYWLCAPTRGPAPRLSMTFFAGEPLTGTLVAGWRSATGSGQRVVNLYGTAEATLAQAWYEVPAECAAGVQPVGTPLPGVDIAVLDPDGRRCETEVSGEFVVESAFLSHGYLSDDHRTRPGKGDRRVPPRPLAGPLPIHRTGDRGYRSRVGLLHVVGRIDREVKIRGARVNLDEVAVVLSGHPLVDAAVVVTGEDRIGGRRLEAHLAVHGGPAPSARELRRYLAARLPDQMVPGVYHIWPELPLGATGKVSVRQWESSRTTEVGEQ